MTIPQHDSYFRWQRAGRVMNSDERPNPEVPGTRRRWARWRVGFVPAGAEVEVGVGEECVKQGLLVFLFLLSKVRLANLHF